METDIQVLSARISRLEILLGSQKQKPCVHEAAKSALANLRKQVPDEITAAHRAVTLLSRATTRTITPINLDALIAALEQLEPLQTSLRPPKHNVDAAELTNLQIRVARIANIVREEERQLDRLLTEFDAVTARLNHAIVALAQQVSARDG